MAVGRLACGLFVRVLVVVLVVVGLPSRARADPPAATKAEARSGTTDEVVIRGRTQQPDDPGEISLSNEEVRKVPGAFGDAFRAVEALPGATPFQSGTPYTILRGAPPGNSAALIDGVSVPLLYHLAIGPSVIHPELIERVDYFPGGAPAEYGRSVGGVVAAKTRKPAGVAHGNATLRAFDAGALVESPFADGRANALVAGRYSYTAAALSLLSPGVEIGYWDYQARAGIDLDDHGGDRDRISVFAFGSHDRRGQLADYPTTFTADFHRVDVRFDRKLGGGGAGAGGAGGGNLRIATTLGDDASSNEQGSTHGRLARVRLEIDRPIDATARVRMGADASFNHVDAGKPKAEAYAARFAQIYPEHNDLVTGVWADVVWRPSPRIEIIPGARVDLYEWRVFNVGPPAESEPHAFAFGEEPEATTSIPAIDPRLALRFTLHRNVAVTSTVGLHHQGPGFFVPVPGLQPGGFQHGLQSSLQKSVGAELLLPAADILATGTLFAHDYDNITSFGRCPIPSGGFDLTSSCIQARSVGRAVGLEVLVKRPLTTRHRLGGWIAYTLSRTVDRPISQPLSEPTPTEFDHTHVLNLVSSLDLGRGWIAGVRLFYYTGRPFTPTKRSRDFARIDLRLEKRWPFMKSGTIAIVAEGLNVAFASEESGVVCSGVGPNDCKVIDGAPIVIPSIGIEASW